MAENPDDSAGDNEKARADAANAEREQNRETICRWSWRRSSAPEKTSTIDEEADEAAAETAAAASRAHSSRFLMLAASVAFAAAFGSFVGSVSGSGLARYPGSGCAGFRRAKTTTDAARQTKLDLPNCPRSRPISTPPARSTTSQFAKLSDRLDQARSAPARAETTGSIAAASRRRRRHPAETDRPRSCRIGSCRTCRTAALWSEPLRRHVRCRRGQHACPASAASTRSSARTASGSC